MGGLFKRSLEGIGRLLRPWIPYVFFLAACGGAYWAEMHWGTPALYDRCPFLKSDPVGWVLSFCIPLMSVSCAIFTFASARFQEHTRRLGMGRRQRLVYRLRYDLNITVFAALPVQLFCRIIGSYVAFYAMTAYQLLNFLALLWFYRRRSDYRRVEKVVTRRFRRALGWWWQRRTLEDLLNSPAVWERLEEVGLSIAPPVNGGEYHKEIVDTFCGLLAQVQDRALAVERKWDWNHTRDDKRPFAADREFRLCYRLARRALECLEDPHISSEAKGRIHAVVLADLDQRLADKVREYGGEDGRCDPRVLGFYTGMLSGMLDAAALAQEDFAQTCRLLPMGKGYLRELKELVLAGLFEFRLAARGAPLAGEQVGLYSALDAPKAWQRELLCALWMEWSRESGFGCTRYIHRLQLLLNHLDVCAGGDAYFAAGNSYYLLIYKNALLLQGALRSSYPPR